MGFLGDNSLQMLLGSSVQAPDELKLDHTLQLQPASIDLRLDRMIRRFNDEEYLDVPITDLEEDPASGELEYYTWGDSIILKPGEFILAQTVERISVDVDKCAKVEGRSSWGRRGVMIHVTAGFLDPGFVGNVTLEIVNLRKRPVKLRAGGRICQVRFAWLESFPGTPEIASNPYSGGRSHYFGQGVPTVAAPDFLGETDEV